MSKSLSSPTASLLRTSRLFSLPKPLPPAAVEQIAGPTLYRTSDTATTPYPTHQAISTPSSSHARGDWGLKRRLPARGTRRKTAVRIRAHDTQTHITDFESAGDHVRTLQKWTEMGIPMTQRVPEKISGSKQVPLSVYENRLDRTDPSVTKGSDEDDESSRWRYTGPWIPGMSESEFVQYLEKSVAERKDEWRDFTRRLFTGSRYVEAREAARNNGEADEFNSTARVNDFTPTDTELAAFEKDLRDAHVKDDSVSSGLNSDLTKIIIRFLDLPALTKDSSSGPALSGISDHLTIGLSEYLDTSGAPPTTHPGAGLSHIRTNAVMENHPIHGPQAKRSPVLARVLQPRSSGVGSTRKALLGVGGVVALDPVNSSQNVPLRNRARIRQEPQAEGVAGMYDPERMSLETDLEMYGGNKMFVHPMTASIDENSRIVLEVSRGDREAVAVRTGEVQAIHEAKAQSITASPSQYRVSPNPMPPLIPGQKPANYGTHLPDREKLRGMPPARRRPITTGFDARSETVRRLREAVDRKD